MPGTVLVPGSGTRIDALNSTRVRPTTWSRGRRVRDASRGRLTVSIRCSQGVCATGQILERGFRHRPRPQFPGQPGPGAPQQDLRGDEHQRQGHDLRDAVEKRDAAWQGEHQKKQTERPFMKLRHDPVHAGRVALDVFGQHGKPARDLHGLIGLRHHAGVSCAAAGPGPDLVHRVANRDHARQRALDAIRAPFPFRPFAHRRRSGPGPFAGKARGDGCAGVRRARKRVTDFDPWLRMIAETGAGGGADACAGGRAGRFVADQRVNRRRTDVRRPQGRKDHDQHDQAGGACRCRHCRVPRPRRRGPRARRPK